MKAWVRRAVPFCVVMAMAVGWATTARAQQAEPQGPPETQQQTGNAAPPLDEAEQRMLKKMAQERNVNRQKELVDDANKLLDLAKKLKAEVDKTDKDELSLSVVDTAAQIEKLAKTVKEKMRDGE